MVFEKWETVYKTAAGIYIFVDNPHLLGYNLWLWYLTKWRRRLKEFKRNHFVTKNGGTFSFPVSPIKGTYLEFLRQKASLLWSLITYLFLYSWCLCGKMIQSLQNALSSHFTNALSSQSAEHSSSSGGYPGGCAAWFHGEDGAHPWDKA